MKLVIINGSPKGEKSVTLQYIQFLKKKFGHIDFRIFHVGKMYKTLEMNSENMNALEEALKNADGIIWTFGVYIDLVPYQLKRFIEHIMNTECKSLFTNKQVITVSTSARWLDMIAHNYMQAICDDLNMKYVGFYSAETEDLIKENEQERLEYFFRDFENAIVTDRPYEKRYASIETSDFVYSNDKPIIKKEIVNKRVTIITDHNPNESKDQSLMNMVEHIKFLYDNTCKVVNLNDLDIKNGCIACFKCAYENKCVFEALDNYNETLNSDILTADILVFAGRLSERYYSSRWKMYFDRNFVYGHIPIYRNKQILVVTSGKLSQNQPFRDSIEMGQDWHRSNLVGFISDESEDNNLIASLIETHVDRSIIMSENSYVKTPTFASIGISKLIRDELFRYQRSIMKADNRFYKSNRLYDFPKMQVGHSILGVFYNFKWFRKYIHSQSRLDDIFIDPHKKIVNSICNEKGAKNE